MKSDQYAGSFCAANMMGPNSLRLLDELLGTYPLACTPDNRIMDLGCGTGMTSLFAAKETGAAVHAVDLWISEAENRARFAGWNMPDRLTPVHADANALPFPKEMFDAVISVDSYHYYGGREGFFAEKILPHMKKGGVALIAVPGLKSEFDGRSEELLAPWLGDEAYMFQSAAFWKRIIGAHEDIAEVRTWEMSCFDQPWQEWFDTGHEFALGDKAFYDTLIEPYTAFIGIMVQKTSV